MIDISGLQLISTHSIRSTTIDWKDICFNYFLNVLKSFINKSFQGSLKRNFFPTKWVFFLKNLDCDVLLFYLRKYYIDEEYIDVLLCGVLFSANNAVNVS